MTALHRCVLASAIVPILMAGCAIHYYDEETGVEHLIGLGHMKMRVTDPNEGVRAVVTSTEIYGAGLRIRRGGQDAASGWPPSNGVEFIAGWDRSTRMLVADDTTIRLQGRDKNLFETDVGSLPPFWTKELVGLEPLRDTLGEEPK